MPALPPVANVLRINLNYTLGSDPLAMNRFFIKYTGTAPSNAALNTFAGTVSSTWLTHMAPIHSSAVTMNLVTVTDLTSPTSGQGSNNATRTGTRVGSGMAGGSSVMIDFHIQRRYRGGKPRIYLPAGVVTDLGTAQAWLAPSVSAFQTAWNNWTNAIIAAPPAGATLTNLVNVSYYSGWEAAEGSTGRPYAKSKVRTSVTPDDIVQMLVDPRVASQRRRQRP